MDLFTNKIPPDCFWARAVEHPPLVQSSILLSSVVRSRSGSSSRSASTSSAPPCPPSPACQPPVLLGMYPCSHQTQSQNLRSKSKSLAQQTVTGDECSEAVKDQQRGARLRRQKCQPPARAASIQGPGRVRCGRRALVQGASL
eukprot:19724-Pleurochrysis_carterae.AAC.1